MHACIGLCDEAALFIKRVLRPHLYLLKDFLLLREWNISTNVIFDLIEN